MEGWCFEDLELGIGVVVTGLWEVLGSIFLGVSFLEFGSLMVGGVEVVISWICGEVMRHEVVWMGLRGLGDGPIRQLTTDGGAGLGSVESRLCAVLGNIWR